MAGVKKPEIVLLGPLKPVVAKGFGSGLHDPQACRSAGRSRGAAFIGQR